MSSKNRKRRGRGEGSIFQRDDGRWVAKVSLGLDQNGKRRRRVVYGTTKKEVQERLRKLQEQVDKGILADASRVSVKDYLASWLKTVQVSKAAHTYLQYEQHSRLHLTPILGHLLMAKLTRQHVKQMYVSLAEKGVSASQQRRVGTTLRAAVGQAMEDEILHLNPCRKVPKPRVEKEEMQVWDPDQVARFLEAAKEDRLYALYVLAIDGGLRQGELFGLQWTDFDFATSSVLVQRALEEVRGSLRLKDLKTKKSRRRVVLSTVALGALHEHRKRMLAAGQIDGPVFCDTDGGYLRKSNVVRRSFNVVVKRAGVPRIRFQDLRHTSATLLLLSNENLKVVSERLGHASVKITGDTYSHVTPTMQQAAAEKMARILSQPASQTAGA
jgi:integrase